MIMLLALTAAWQPVKRPPAEKMATAVMSPDGKLVARVYSSVSSHKGECRVEIRLKDGPFLRMHDFFSADGQHGYSVSLAEWTANSQFLVLGMTNVGGHSSTDAPVVFWSRERNAFYELLNYTAELDLKLIGGDRLELSTWPGLKPATISLHELSKEQISEIH